MAIDGLESLLVWPGVGAARGSSGRRSSLNTRTRLARGGQERSCDGALAGICLLWFPGMILILLWMMECTVGRWKNSVRKGAAQVKKGGNKS